MDRNKVIAGLTATAGLTTGIALGNMSDQALTQVQDIAQVQQERFVTDGHYMQVLPGGFKPSDAADKGRQRNFPDNMRVDVYDGPQGKGYTVVETLPDGREIHVSYGPEAAQRSIITGPNDISASSTPSI